MSTSPAQNSTEMGEERSQRVSILQRPLTEDRPCSPAHTKGLPLGSGIQQDAWGRQALTRKGPSTSQPGQGARDPEPGGFCSLSVHPPRGRGRWTWHGGCSLPRMRGIHWPSYPWLPGPRGKEERKEKVGVGQRVRQQLRSCRPRAAVAQVVHCSRAVG